MIKVEENQPIDPNVEAYQRLKEDGELPEGRFHFFVQGELVASSDYKDFAENTVYRWMIENGINLKEIKPVWFDTQKSRISFK